MAQLASYTPRTLAREVIMLLLAAGWWIPFYLLIVVALKPPAEAISSPFALPQHIDLGNFATAWQGSGGVGMGQALVNSAVITVGSVLALIVIGALAAYGVARQEPRLGGVLYIAFVMGIIVPTQLGIVPIYVALRHLGLLGTLAGAVLLYTGILMPLSVFLYTGFVRSLPTEYEEAAFIDGATQLQAFVRIVFPLLAPITGTVAVLCSLIIWNDFFTQPVAVYDFVGQYETQWNVVFAAVAISLAPVLAFYLFAQRRLIRGFTGGLR